MTVIATLNRSKSSAAVIGREAESSEAPNRFWITEVIGMVRRAETPTPRIPANSPTITVSALNTCEIFRFDAPIARKIPISFVRSNTEMCVIIPIIILETISDTATNAIST